ncbi:hypothetical protein D3C72_2259310 [compost metagenome]
MNARAPPPAIAPPTTAAVASAVRPPVTNMSALVSCSLLLESTVPLRPAKVTSVPFFRPCTCVPVPEAT